MIVMWSSHIGILALILIRTLRRDIARYNMRDEELVNTICCHSNKLLTVIHIEYSGFYNDLSNNSIMNCMCLLVISFNWSYILTVLIINCCFC